MSDHVEAFKALAVKAFPHESGQVVVEAGSVAYVVTLEDGVATSAEPVTTS